MSTPTLYNDNNDNNNDNKYLYDIQRKKNWSYRVDTLHDRDICELQLL